MTGYGVTEAGFIRKPYVVILTEVQTSMRQLLGQDVDVSPSSPLGQIAQIFAFEVAKIWVEMERVYDAAYIDTAAGIHLQKLGRLNGMTINPATYATGEVVFSRATPAPQEYVIPAGTVVASADRTILYTTTAAGSLAAGATVSDPVSIRAVEPGIRANLAMHTVVAITTPILGVDYVTNPQAVTGGADRESDAVYRARMKTYEPASRGTVHALRSKLLDIDGVLDLNIVEDTDANTVSVSILGGADAAISAEIEETRPAGIAVTWSRPTVVPVDVTAQLRTSVSDTEAVVQNVTSALAMMLQSWSIGASIDYSVLVSAVLAVDGVTSLVSLSASADEQTISGFDQQLTIAAGEATSPGTITVTVV